MRRVGNSEMPINWTRISASLWARMRTPTYSIRARWHFYERAERPRNLILTGREQSGTFASGSGFASREIIKARRRAAVTARARHPREQRFFKIFLFSGIGQILDSLGIHWKFIIGEILPNLARVKPLSMSPRRISTRFRNDRSDRAASIGTLGSDLST